ncbi:MAG: hypothetical protein NTX25_17985 [Proteobacteria bacterium]|nr:hypothetical protein [Pseudomonadota bacterium]
MRYNFLVFYCLLFSIFSANKASAAISISLSGSSENSNASLERYRSNSLSANVSLGLGNNFQVGLTHRRSLDNRVGLKRQSGTDANTYEYLPFRDNSLSITNSVDLTIIPYNGVVSPMIFGGIARRDYENQLDFLDSRSVSKQTMFPIPTYGFGAMIQLGMGMQLKITQTYSPGIETSLEDGEEVSRVVKDSYTQVWLGYRL